MMMMMMSIRASKGLSFTDKKDVQSSHQSGVRPDGKRLASLGYPAAG
jgi:hypothetical protein